MLILPESIKTLINGFMAIFVKKEDLKQSDWLQADTSKIDFIKNKPAIATEEDTMELITDLGYVTPVTSSSGEIYTDSKGNIISL